MHLITFEASPNKAGLIMIPNHSKRGLAGDSSGAPSLSRVPQSTVQARGGHSVSSSCTTDACMLVRLAIVS